jgi:Domain of unknown function (DUF4203)
MEHAAAPAPFFLVVLVGAFCLLFGYRYVRFSSKLGSALLGVVLGLTAGPQLQNGWLVAALLAAAAVAGWLLGNAYYYVNMAIFGAFMGVMGMFLAALAAGGALEWSSGLASAILGAMLTIRFERPLVVLGTSMAGAAMLVQTGHADPAWGAAVAFVALTLLGCLFQAGRMKRAEARRPVPGDP